MASNDYLIDKLLPANEIHLLAGPTGSGKTRWLFQTLLEWQSGLPILGHRSHPVPWVYVAADRSKHAAKRTLNDMGIESDRIPFIDAWDRHLTLSSIFDAIKAKGAQLAVIEAFGSFVDPPGRSNQVKAFLQSAHTALNMNGITVIGVMESPKMKPRDKYENPRQRVSGVATWGHFTETIFVVEPSKPDDPSDPGRRFYCCPRNGQGISLGAEIRPPLGTFHYVPS